MKSFISGLIKFSAITILVFSLLACGGAEERKVKYLEKGKAYLEENNLDKAKIEFKNVLQIDPKFAEAYYYMGQLEEKNKELGKSLGNYKKAIELNPKYTLAKIKLAKIYVVAGTEDYIASAEKLLAEAKKEQPDNTEVKMILATIEYKTGSKAKATKELELVVKEDKNLKEAISLLASIYLSEGKQEKALHILKRGTVDNPDNIPLRITLAQLLAKRNELVEAEKYLKQVLAIEPEMFSLQVALSSFYASSNQLDKAEAVLRNAIKQDDEDAQRYLVLIEMLTSRRSIKEGEEELKAAIRNKPDLYDLKFAQVNFYEKTGRREQAKDALNQIILDKAYDVEGVNARIQLAKYYLEEGDSKSAKKYIAEVIKEYPNNNDALLITSKLSLSNFDSISAINGLRTVLKNDPQNAEASLLLAQAHELNNESTLAENELKKAIEANPVNDKVHVNYAKYLGSKGRIDEAVNVVDRALAYFKDSYDLMSIKLKILVSQGKDSEIATTLDLMEQSNPSKAEVNLTKGQYYVSKRKIPQAIDEFEKAYKKSQNKFKSLQFIVRTYMTSNQPEKAIERLQKILDTNADDSISNLLMGQILLAQKKIPEARKKFIHSSKFAESWFPPYTGLANTYLIEKNIDKAFSVYQDAESKLKNKVPAQMQMAAIYEKKKDYASAMEVYQRILATNSGNKLATNNYASLLLDYGNASDLPKALELSKSFEKLQQPALQDTLGWAYAKTGDSAKAVEILKPIVEKAPKIAIFRYHLGYALYEMGDKAAAKSHLEIASSSEQTFPGKDKAAELLKTL